MGFRPSGSFNRPQEGFGGSGRGGSNRGGQGGSGRPGGFGSGGKPSREDFFNRAKKRVQVAISSRDNLLIQSVGAVDELNKASNLLFERLSEWYGMYFPEFRAGEPPKYVQGVLMIDRKNPNVAEIEAAFGEQAPSILQKAKTSLGSDLSPEDLAEVRLLANQIEALWALRTKVEEYQAKIAQEVCPNMSHIAGPLLAAKLVAQSGGLQRMATFPASTIQVLGAEKALFKHLKSGSKPPKHGLIFQHPFVGRAPRKLRGKLARALAAKLTIASKADALSHNFIAEKLKQQFETQVKRIMASAPK